MTFYKQPRFFVTLGVAIVGLLILQQIWQWEVERIEVPSGKFLIRISRWGKDLGPDEIIAPDESYKGVMLQPWGEGRHFLNPFFWTYEVHDMVQVPVGQCLVLTRRFGKPLSAARMEQGDILGAEDPANPSEGERGILRDVLTPGSYRLNNYAYSWEPVPAIEVRVDQVGVRTLKVGKDPRTLKPDAERGHYVVPEGYRGIQQATVPAGTYYINPYVESITPVEVRSHRVKLGDIEFPSRDGFILKPQVVVEYAAQPEKAPELMVRLTDEGILHQKDETAEDQLQNEILQKVILPHIRGYARIEGSNFDARDFILAGAVAPPEAGEKVEKAANAREALQRALLAKVKPQCDALGVEVRAVTLADMLPPPELSEQIAARTGARRAGQECRALAAIPGRTRTQVEGIPQDASQGKSRGRNPPDPSQDQSRATQGSRVFALQTGTRKCAARARRRRETSRSHLGQREGGSRGHQSAKRSRSGRPSQGRAGFCQRADIRPVSSDEKAGAGTDRDFCLR